MDKNLISLNKNNNEYTINFVNKVEHKKILLNVSDSFEDKK